jgi:hypothetical protein
MRKLIAFLLLQLALLPVGHRVLLAAVQVDFSNSVCVAACGCPLGDLCTQSSYRVTLDLIDGLNNGTSTGSSSNPNVPLIDLDFLSFEEGHGPCTWFPYLDAGSGVCMKLTVNDKQISIGAGINLYQLTKFLGWRTDPVTICNKSPWTQCHVEFTPAERVEFNEKFHSYYAGVIEERYNASKAGQSSSPGLRGDQKSERPEARKRCPDHPRARDGHCHRGEESPCYETLPCWAVLLIWTL